MEHIIVGVIDLFLLAGLVAAIADGFKWALRGLKRSRGKKA